MWVSENDQAASNRVQKYDAIGKYLTHKNLFQLTDPFNMAASPAEV